MKELLILLILVLAVIIFSVYMAKPQEKLHINKKSINKPKRNVKFSNITDVRMFDKGTGDILFDTIKDIN